MNGILCNISYTTWSGGKVFTEYVENNKRENQAWCILYMMWEWLMYVVSVCLFFLNHIKKLAFAVHVYFGMSNSVASKKQYNIEGRNNQGNHII
jgi:hypothetical protein